MGSIMVVEDENLVSLHIRKTLEIKGYEVTAVATSGEEAVIKAGETHPDLILMDIRLKGEMDGIEAAGKIRETLDIPIIYLTAYADNDTLDRAKSTGAHGYIIKPFQDQDIYSSVEIALIKHQMERKIKESESSYRALSEQMPDALFLLELDDPEVPAKIIEVNDTALRMHGYRRDELIGQSISILDDSETAKNISGHIKELTEKRSVTFEGGHLRKDGSTFPVEVMARMITLKGKDVALCIDRDISERKRSEEALNESHERLLSVLNSIDAGVYVADMETYEVLYLNKYMEEKFGDVTGQKCWKVFQSGQSGPCNFCTNDKLLTPEGKPAEVYDWEFHNTVNDQWYHLRDRAIKWVDGRTVRLEFVTDITERKRSEEEKRLVQARLKHLLTSTPTVIYSCKKENNDFVPTFVSENMKKLTGYDHKDFLGNPDQWASNIHPEDKERVFTDLAKHSHEDYHEHEYRFRKKDGTYCWVHDELNLLHDEEGGPLEIVGSWTDITERREAEQEVRFLSEVTENMSEGVMVTNTSELAITYVNRKFEEMFGYDQGELIGKPVSVLNASVDETPDETSNEIVQCLKEKAAWEGEIRNITKKGKLFWSHASITPFKHDRYGTIWISVQTDITERKELKNKLERNVEALANGNKAWMDTFDAISDPLFTCDKGLRIIKANRAYQKEAALPFKELIGKKYWEVFPQMDGPFDCCEILDQEPCIWEDRDFVDAATKKVFRVRVFSITGLEGEPDYSLYTLENVTELKKTQEMLIQSAKLASIGELGSNIAHEINNPMTAVLGFASYILEEIGEASPYFEDLKAVEGEALRVRGIVRNLLDFARQRKLRKDEADINMVLSEALTLVTHMAEIAHIKIETELGEDLPDIMIDVNQIKQVFVNLVNNACHAMEWGGTLRIRTEIKQGKSGEEDQIHISFKDTGCGIPEEIMKHLFEPFYTTKGEKGTGLGLSVSYGIVQNHNGYIVIESEVGQGSKFIVMLPCGGGGSHA